MRENPDAARLVNCSSADTLAVLLFRRADKGFVRCNTAPGHGSSECTEEAPLIGSIPSQYYKAAGSSGAPGLEEQRFPGVLHTLPPAPSR